MPRWAHNKLPSSVRQRFFELIRAGLKVSEPARRVGVSHELRWPSPRRPDGWL